MSCGGSLLPSGDFRLLRAVLGPTLVASVDAGCVEGAAYYMVANAREVFHTAAAHEHDRVLLEVVSFARDVGDDLEPVRQAHLGHFAQRRVRLLGRRRVDAGADTATERIRLERRRLFFLENIPATPPDELIDRWH